MPTPDPDPEGSSRRPHGEALRPRLPDLIGQDRWIGSGLTVLVVLPAVAVALALNPLTSLAIGLAGAVVLAKIVLNELQLKQMSTVPVDQQTSVLRRTNRGQTNLLVLFIGVLLTVRIADGLMAGSESGMTTHVYSLGLFLAAIAVTLLLVASAVVHRLLPYPEEPHVSTLSACGVRMAALEVLLSATVFAPIAWVGHLLHRS